MSTDDIYILGITMTKFGKHPDKDVVDLGAEAAMAALADAGVTMGEMGILAYGNLVGQSFGQMLQKQIGQTGIPVFNVQNACATGATALRTAIMAIKAGEAHVALAGLDGHDRRAQRGGARGARVGHVEDRDAGLADLLLELRADAGVTMGEMGILAAGNLMNASAGFSVRRC